MLCDALDNGDVHLASEVRTNHIIVSLSTLILFRLLLQL